MKVRLVAAMGRSTSDEFAASAASSADTKPSAKSKAFLALASLLLGIGHGFPPEDVSEAMKAVLTAAKGVRVSSAREAVPPQTAATPGQSSARALRRAIQS